MPPLLLSSYTLTTCLGRGLATTLNALRSGLSGLRPCAFETVELDTWIGEVADVEAESLPEPLARYDCRNNRLVQLGLETDGFADQVREAADRYGRSRVGVFLGTSTAGILQRRRLGWRTYRQPNIHRRRCSECWVDGVNPTYAATVVVTLSGSLLSGYKSWPMPGTLGP